MKVLSLLLRNACWSPRRRTRGSLNESPELIAQECHELDPCRAGPDASMKVLSLLLRNSTIPLAVASLAGPQ